MDKAAATDEQGEDEYIGRFFPGTKSRDMDSAKSICSAVVKDAVRRGTLIRRPCEKCGVVKSEAHHNDYGYPLKVHWLCKAHHSDWHSKHQAIISRQPEVPPKRKYKSVAGGVKAAKSVIMAVTKELANMCQREAFDQVELARRMGSSRQYVSTLFAGGFRTVKTIVGVADYLGYDVRIVFVRRGKLDIDNVSQHDR